MEFAIVLGIVATALVFDYINGSTTPRFDRDGGVDARAVARTGGRLGRLLQLRRAFASARRCKNRRVGHDRHQLRHARRDLLRPRRAIAWDLITWYFGCHEFVHALIAVTRCGRGQGGWGVIIRLAGPRRCSSSSCRRSSPDRRLGLMVASTGCSASPHRPRRSLVPEAAARIAALFSLNHGANDAQKTWHHRRRALHGAGVSGRRRGRERRNVHPVLDRARGARGDWPRHAVGGWRIIHTMGSRITKLQPVHGFAPRPAPRRPSSSRPCWAFPSAPRTRSPIDRGRRRDRRLSAVRWGVAGQIVWAWILTIPGAAIIGMSTYLVLGLFGAR